MATSGKITGTAYKNGVANPDYTFWADWVRNSKSDANNTSNITVYLRIQNTKYADGAYNLDKKPSVSLNVNGAAKTPTIKIIDTRENVVSTFATWTGNVSHNADGSLSCPIVASFTHYGSASLTSGSLSGNAKLDAIPRASTVSLADSSIRMGEAVVINIDRKSSGFTHTLRYAFGDLTGTIATGVGVARSWTVPTSFAAQIKNNTSGIGRIYCDTYSGSTKIGTTSVTFTAAVPAATVPTLSASTIALGSRLTVTMNRAADSFTHTLKYKFGTQEGTIGTGLGTSKAWTVPLILAKEIPAKTIGTLTITCETYNGTAKVGSKSVTVTVTVPENDQTRPAVDMTLSVVSDLPSVFAGLHIKGKTKLKATFDAQSEYSTIKSYALVAGSARASGNPGTTGFLLNTGTVTVKGTVYDARGYDTSVIKEITVLPYENPSVVPYGKNKAVVCERCTADGTPNSGGVNLLIQAGRRYSPVTADGVQKNFCSLKYRIKASTAASFPGWTELIGTGAGSNEISTVLTNLVPSVTTSYDVQLMVEDTLGGEHILDFIVPTDEVTFHLAASGKGAAFGKYAELENALEVAEDWDSHFRGNVDGRVYGLGKLPELHYNTDFNDCVTIGCYIVGGPSVDISSINRPSIYRGVLIVSSIDGSGVTTEPGSIILQKFTVLSGEEYYRMAYLKSDGQWLFYDWEARSDSGWMDLGLGDNVSVMASNFGRVGIDCRCRVINENHVHVAFNCAFTFAGEAIIVNKNAIPEKYRPKRNQYAMCATGGRAIARVMVNAEGNILVDWVQSLSSGAQTDSANVSWIDGYIDYWI